MNSLTDQQLLRDYAGSRSETAFAELVRRHIDLVYSAAVRMVRDPHLAEDVTQGAFMALAQNAKQLTNRPVLAGWLHRTAQNLAANAVRAEVRRRVREQKSAAMNDQFSNETDATWDHIAPHLDAALDELSETDRDVLLFRYFQGKSAREIAQTLGLSDEAAQKRVNRAVERLREIFAKRGVAIGAGSLLILISANAVQSAPIGLLTAISTAVLTGTITTTTIATHSTMNWLTIKGISSILTAALVAGTGTYFVQQREANRLRSENQNLVAAQQKLAAERDAATSAAATFNNELERARKERNELVRLRSEVSQLRKQTNEITVLHEQNRQLQAVAKQVITQNQETPHTEAVKAMNACINNLRQIDGAKQQYALEYKLSATDTVTAENILPYLVPRDGKHALPDCPSGGTYTIGRLDAAPTCSVPGHVLY